MLVTAQEICYTHGGEMSEWSKVPLSKSGKVQAFVGSNPTLSVWRSLIVV